METDLVLSVIKNLPWMNIDCYAISLVKSGFKGKKVMFVEDVPEDAQDNLINLGFEVIPFTTPSDISYLHFQTYRYIPAREYLRKNRDFRYVIWTDVTDLVFQTDPTTWIEQNIGSYELIAAIEGWLIKNQGINDVWIKRLVPEDEYNRIRQRDALCSGSIFGRSKSMLALIETMCDEFSPDNDMQGIDQGIFNWIVSKSPFKDITMLPDPSRGLVCSCGAFLAESNPEIWTIEPPVFDKDSGLVYTPHKEQLFSIVHQYNRHHGRLDIDGSWRGILERRYRNQ